MFCPAVRSFARVNMAISKNQGSFLWVPPEYGPYYSGSILTPVMVGNPHILALVFFPTYVPWTC